MTELKWFLRGVLQIATIVVVSVLGLILFV
jgi:hypothetical protein